jgi:class 3 adenylate cyclase
MPERACQTCGTVNPGQARFCMSCGSTLERTCGVCGTANPPDARFCMNCGSALDAATPGPPSAPAPAPAAVREPAGTPEQPPEERRQVSVVFADLSGYTAVAERMDPEAVKSLVDRSLQRLGQEVTRFGGSVDKYIGDNVMAVFGAPVAHEDDAERAVRAALGMQEAMVELNEQLSESHGVSLLLRVGVNTGEVVAGAVGDGYTVIGDTVNVAARLQELCRDGDRALLVSEAAHELARAAGLDAGMTLRDAVSLRGRREPVRVFGLE